MIETHVMIVIIVWIMIVEYLIIDFYYFNREQELRKKWFDEHMDFIYKIYQGFKDVEGVEVSVEKRIECPTCKYPMRILEETDEYYGCYCAGCKRDRVIDKRK